MSLIDTFVYANLEKERHFIDNHSMRVFPCGDSAPRLVVAGDTRVNDCFECRRFLGWTEDDASEHLSIERAVRFEDCRPK